MNWIKITPKTELPTGSRVFLREVIGKSLYYKAGTIQKDGYLLMDAIKSEEHLSDFTHYCLITEPTI